jgi:hypothetical protein
MIISLLTLATVSTGMVIGWLLLRRSVPVVVPAGHPPTAERTIWSRSARELYRTVVGVVDDPDPAGAAGTDAADPVAHRAWLNGAVVRARGASTWAVALHEQALGADAERACARVAADLTALADAAASALADPDDVGRVRVLDARRAEARRSADRLIRLL